MLSMAIMFILLSGFVARDSCFSLVQWLARSFNPREEIYRYIKSIGLAPLYRVGHVGIFNAL